MLYKLCTQLDFNKLVSDDIRVIADELNLSKKSNAEICDYLYANREKVFKNHNIKEIIVNRIFAGKGSAKWYRIAYDSHFTKQKMLENLHEPKNHFDVTLTNDMVLDDNDIASIIHDDGTYTLKVIVPDGSIQIPNGLEFRMEERKKAVIVKIDVDNCWIEVRSDAITCKHVIDIIKAKLKIKNCTEIAILHKYENNMEKFKDALENGFFYNYTAMPTTNCGLTEEGSMVMCQIVDAVDTYLINRDEETFIKALKAVADCDKVIPIRNIFLAGLEKISVKIRENSKKDMENQGMYNLLKEQLYVDTSFIQFAVGTKNETRNGSIKLGIKSNSIAFLNAATEKEIEYIRNKIL